MSTPPTTLLAIEPLDLFDKLSLAWRIPLLGRSHVRLLACGILTPS